MSNDVPLRDAAQALLDDLTARANALHAAGPPRRRAQIELLRTITTSHAADRLRAALAAADTAPTREEMYRTLRDSLPMLFPGSVQLVRATDAVMARLAAADGTTPTQPDEVPGVG